MYSTRESRLVALIEVRLDCHKANNGTIKNIVCFDWKRIGHEAYRLLVNCW